MTVYDQTRLDAIIYTTTTGQDPTGRDLTGLDMARRDTTRPDAIIRKKYHDLT